MLIDDHVVVRLGVLGDSDYLVVTAFVMSMGCFFEDVCWNCAFPVRACFFIHFSSLRCMRARCFTWNIKTQKSRLQTCKRELYCTRKSTPRHNFVLLQSFACLHRLLSLQRFFDPLFDPVQALNFFEDTRRPQAHDHKKPPHYI